MREAERKDKMREKNIKTKTTKTSIKNPRQGRSSIQVNYNLSWQPTDPQTFLKDQTAKTMPLT